MSIIKNEPTYSDGRSLGDILTEAVILQHQAAWFAVRHCRVKSVTFKPGVIPSQVVL